MKVRHKKVEKWTSQKPQKETPRQKNKTEDQRLQKLFEILTACSNQTMNDECQHFGNKIAAKSRNYNETVRCHSNLNYERILKCK